jgi:outer membrane receptor protein involved in Fe transport
MDTVLIATTPSPGTRPGRAVLIAAMTIALVYSGIDVVAAAAEKPAAAQSTQLLELSVDDLMHMKVTTASRAEEELQRSTSVMSVITARDIERAGFRTLYDVLARVPGFFPSSQATWKLVGTRGLLADGNDHILLLVDGHPQNSIVAHGFQQQDQMPTLDKVERIEIIRGPGSVLWGTSAAHAIINIVTRDQGQGLKEVQVSTGYAQTDGLWTINLLKNMQMGDAKGVLSASVWQADGYNTPNGPNVKFPWGSTTNLWPRLDAQNPGFEVYLKLKDGDGQQILARLADTSVPYPWDSWSYNAAGGVRPGAELRMRKAYVDYQNAKRYNDRFKVQYTLYGDMLLQNRFPTEQTGVTPGLDTRWIEDQSREELAFGGEATSTFQVTSANTLRFGTKYVHTIVGPNRGFRFDTATDLPTVPGTNEAQVPVIDIPSGTDNNVAAYAEERLQFNGGKTDLFAGVRADHNDWREQRTVLLPRAGVIHSLSSTLTTKYVFNTGYLRPNAAYSKSGGKFYRAPSKTIEDVNIVDRSEEVRSHDWQITLAGSRDYLVGTAFYMSVDNFISWETKLDLGYRDMGKAYSYGFEAEGRHFLTNRVALTGNYSLARGYLRTLPTGVDVNGVTQVLDGAVTNANREWLNYPMHMWNLGADVSLRDHHTLNLNARGWHKMKIVAPFDAPRPGAYDELGGALYVDATYQAKEMLANLDFRAFVTNLFDNTEPVGMVINNGVFHPRGRNIGFQFSTRF